MSDIYKQREQGPVGGRHQPSARKSSGRRRRTERPAFGDKERKRRSKNSGFRRLLHLSRKSENEKFFWWSMLTFFVTILVLLAIWQFWWVERQVEKQSRENEMRIPISHLEATNLSAEESP